MPIELRVPQLSESMATTKLAVWLKREGDVVTAGEPIAELEADKTSVELEAPATGVLQQICVAAGIEGLQVGGVLALILAREDAPVPAAGSVKSRQPTAAVQPASSNDEHLANLIAHEATAAEPERTGNGTPLARRMAAIAGLNLDDIPGTGPNGRVTKADVDRVLAERRQSSISHEPSATSHAGAMSHQPSAIDHDTPYQERQLTTMRKVTAARLLHAKQTIPHFYLSIECPADALVEMRKRVDACGSDVKLSITDFVVRAAALALRKVPLANATWVEHALRVYDAVHVAVAVDTPEGLVAPVVHDADRKPLVAISRELKSLTERARAGKLQPDEYAGGTFTISNLGMFGVSSLYAIVNPPQCCILGIGAIERRPVVRDGQVAVGSVMTCTLSADHRTIDGATGAALLAQFRRLIEEPFLLVL
jgi:pyruvate dehydrogenase E2 component (dihydrolipoamide acetyltransferase)